MRYLYAIAISGFIICIMQSCKSNTTFSLEKEELPGSAVSSKLIDSKGMTIQERFNTPPGFKRNPVEKNSFASYLRNLALKPAGSKVKYFNGAEKNNLVYDAVVDMDIGTKDLQQCADAVIRLKAEYFYSLCNYDAISFNLTNGFTVAYSAWMQGNRVIIKGNQAFWKKTTLPSNTYKDFRAYLDFIFSYAGTLSLSASLHSKSINDISIGDVFITGGSPGHAEIIVDLAENKLGEKVFLLAQSYMPAQETQILKNPGDSELTPWFSAGVTTKLVTPQWTFNIDELKTW